MYTPENDLYYPLKGLRLPFPTSLKALPHFSRPNRKELDAVKDLQRTYVQQSGISPCVFTTFDEAKILIHVHDLLWNTLEEELSKYDNLAICKYLYGRLEIILGHLHINKYQTSVAQTITGKTQGSDERYDIWRAITPTTEGIKFLIEMAIKHCGEKGLVNQGSHLDYLIDLSTRIVMLDSHLENMYARIIPYEIIITPDFDIDGGISNESEIAIDNFGKVQKPHAAQADRDFIENLHRINGPKIKTEDFRAFPELVSMDKAMNDELGYGFFNWLDYCKGCVGIFGENEFLKIVGVPRLKRHLRDVVGLDSDKVELLLRDNALSHSLVKNIARDDMMPMTNYKRDSRLLRRPLLEIQHENNRIAILGIETFSVGMQIFFEALENGTLQIPRMSQGGPIRSAMGTLQALKGAPFRDEIAKRCISMGLKAETEWPIHQRNKTDKVLGPIDILIIDQVNRRFILVEAKNLQSQGIIPKEMKNQRDRFLGAEAHEDNAFVSILKEKEKAFVSNLKWHIQKLGIVGLNDYSVESVIVVFHPIFWLHLESEPLPILDDLEFYNRLQHGLHFLTSPIITK
jgi:hypothetical protein